MIIGTKDFWWVGLTISLLDETQFWNCLNKSKVCDDILYLTITMQIFIVAWHIPLFRQKSWCNRVEPKKNPSFGEQSILGNYITQITLKTLQGCVLFKERNERKK